MAQHFLLSAQARTLSLRSIFAGGEDQAYETFRKLRWPETDGEAVCPHCGCLDSYEITTRRKFKCAACHRQYSVTSGTIFASRKMGFTDLLAAICIIVNAAKGMSALQLSRDLDCQHKTAFVLAHKIRRSHRRRDDRRQTLTGEVEIDGAYFGGHIRPANRKEDRVDRRRAEHQTGKRRVVIAVPPAQGPHADLRSQDRKPKASDHCRARQSPDRGSYADEGSHWDLLARRLAIPTGSITAKPMRSTAFRPIRPKAISSRLRRMVRGQHHHVSARYLHAYAAHAAWLEDHRRLDNGRLTHRALGLALAHPVSTTWKGYWQRAMQ